ncbi:MAG TPA: hypothetical protein VN605_12260 [Thermoanaerobaculia bacterium]|nr:hypothetical protein [Thermoanaerobaculia bacterium]
MPGRNEQSIVFRNQYREHVAVCVAPATSEQPALAWMTGEAAPGARLRFAWQLDYAFFYALTGPLRNGSIIMPRVIVPAAPPSGARTTFRWDGQSFLLRLAANAREGVLSIDQDSSIPPATASVGVTIDGVPAAIVQAQPSIETNFVLHPVYWLAVARRPVVQGTVVEAATFFAVARIVLTGALKTVTATLTEDGALMVTK